MPATNGEAIEVPCSDAYWSGHKVEAISTPGAETKTSGEPKFENEAGKSNSSVAATPTTPGQAAGDCGVDMKSLPAAATRSAP